MSNLKFSVIIPAYNAAHTLPRCLDSLCGQIREDVELLLTNDGSTDQTAMICQSYADRYSQIRVFSKENGGVSSARNIGLDHARGDYVLFVDADDSVRENYFSVLDEALVDEPELLLFSKQLMRGSFHNQRKVKSVFCADQVASSRILSNSLRKQELNLITTKAFRRVMIETQGLRFDERLDIGEDKVFALAFSLLTTHVKQINAPIYCLSVDNPNSLSRRKRENLCDSVLLEHRLMTELLNKASLPKGCKKLYQDAVNYSFYRSAYTVVGELRKYGLSAGKRREKARTVLDRYAAETGYSSKEISCKVIAMPVLRKRAALIDKIMSISFKRGYR